MDDEATKKDVDEEYDINVVDEPDIHSLPFMDDNIYDDG